MALTWPLDPWRDSVLPAFSRSWLGIRTGGGRVGVLRLGDRRPLSVDEDVVQQRRVDVALNGRPRTITHDNQALDLAKRRRDVKNTLDRP